MAPVAMQQGRYAADLIGCRLRGKSLPPPFHYKDKGQLAVIGRNSAVADLAAAAGPPLRLFRLAAVDIRASNT